jgi:hypothetical protein
MTNLLAQAINCDDADRAAETADPLYADERNFYKVEQWTRDGQHIDRLLFAGNNLDQAEAKFAAFAKKRPWARLTLATHPPPR